MWAVGGLHEIPRKESPSHVHLYQAFSTLFFRHDLQMRVVLPPRRVRRLEARTRPRDPLTCWGEALVQACAPFALSSTETLLSTATEVETELRGHGFLDPVDDSIANDLLQSSRVGSCAKMFTQTHASGCTLVVFRPKVHVYDVHARAPPLIVSVKDSTGSTFGMVCGCPRSGCLAVGLVGSVYVRGGDHGGGGQDTGPGSTAEMNLPDHLALPLMSLLHSLFVKCRGVADTTMTSLNETHNAGMYRASVLLSSSLANVVERAQGVEGTTCSVRKKATGAAAALGQVLGASSREDVLECVRQIVDARLELRAINEALPEPTPYKKMPRVIGKLLTKTQRLRGKLDAMRHKRRRCDV